MRAAGRASWTHAIRRRPRQQPTCRRSLGTIHSVAAAGFQNQADTYESVRPSYPPEAVGYVLELAGVGQGPKRIVRALDLAAGTGKFTRLLADVDQLDVVAVEPVDKMREVFTRVLPPSVPVLKGTSRSIPFGDEHFDMVTVAQAFHWFCDIESLREIHRVLKPGRPFVLLWNMEDKSAPWVAELRDAYEKYDEGIPQYRKGVWADVFSTAEGRGLFSPLQHRFFSQHMLVDRGDVWRRVLSKSYVASQSEEEQGKLRVEVERILDKHDHEFDVVRGGRRMASQPLVTEVAWVQAL